ncbi:MAG: twin-arginine translocase TatA/TatE family subunit [Bacteroidota bacterium]|jgi:sec-independent protein translocase protein TatA|nr:twin-arginine translocase TatA/TatE family subunit [Bacteroidota bacterium]
MPVFLFGLSMGELFIVILVALLLFGSKRIPELARGLGKGIREFRKAAEDIKNEIEGAAGNDDNPGKS